MLPIMKRVVRLWLLLVLIGGVTLAGCPAGSEASITQLNLYGIDPLTLDPAISGEGTSHYYVVQLFSGLVCLGDDSKPAPDVAREWKVSDDGQTYTFYLRRDARFHDGRRVTAEDFVYSWQRACDPATGSLTAATYLGDIVGVGEVLAGESEEISGVRIINDYTLEVTIDSPKTYFLYKLTYPTAFVVDKNNVASGGDWWRQPNGTGPFALKSWDEGSQLVLEKNRLYHGKVAGVDEVVFYLWGGVPMNMYEMGEIDVTGVSSFYIDKVTDEDGPFYSELMVTPELSFYYIGFNTTKPPFDDANIRRAFSLAIDKDKLVSLAFRDMVLRADGILPPAMPGFDGNLSVLDYDVSEALRLIEESPYGSVSQLPPITLTTVGWGGNISSSLGAMVHQWRQNLGVEVKVRQLEPDRFLYHLKEEKDEMYEMGWIADYPHPQNFLDVLFHSQSEKNYGEYSNPAVDALLEAARVAADDALSLELYRQVEQELIDDAACFPLWFGCNYVLVKPYVKGYALDLTGVAMLNQVSLD